jgi:anti-sigma factor ChrR (cupin superfamily)
MKNDICELVSLYAVGALDSAEEQEFERHLASCASCGWETVEFRETAACLALLAATPPPESLRRRVLEKVFIAKPAALVRREEGEWTESAFPGLSIKQLFADPATGNVTSMIRMRPGASYPGHLHAGFEHCYVLEGDLVFEDHALSAGDFEVAAPHTRHGTVTTTAGCLLLITNNTADQVFL